MRHGTAQRGMGIAIAASVWVAIGGVGSLAGTAHAQTPSLRFIQPTPGYENVLIEDIADDGTVVGMSYDGVIPGIGLVFRESVAGLRTEYVAGSFARVSGDGQVVAMSLTGPDRVPLVYNADGSVHSVPGLNFLGQDLPAVRVTHLNGNGSVALVGTGLQVSPGIDAVTAYRWDRTTNTVQVPPFPGGSSYNTVESLTSDGRIMSGLAAPDIFGPYYGYVWDATQASFTQMTYPDGSPINFSGDAPVVSGDGSTIFVREFDTVMIRNGVSTFWNPSGLAGHPRLLPEDVSNDGLTAVGRGRNGYWLWTPDTGAMYIVDYMRLIGLDIPTGTQTGPLLISGDGEHIAGLLAMPTGTETFILTIPTPGAIGILCLMGLAVTSRRRRPDTTLSIDSCAHRASDSMQPTGHNR